MLFIHNPQSTMPSKRILLDLRNGLEMSNWCLYYFPYYKQKYERIMKRRGKKRAIIAIARMILTAIYQMLSTGEAWNPTDLYWRLLLYLSSTILKDKLDYLLPWMLPRTSRFPLFSFRILLSEQFCEKYQRIHLRRPRRYRLHRNASCNCKKNAAGSVGLGVLIQDWLYKIFSFCFLHSSWNQF